MAGSSTQPRSPGDDGSVDLRAADAAGLTEQLQALIREASRHAARWEVEMDGSPESVRYAVECAGLEAQCRPAWHPGLHHVAATVDSNMAAALQDAWSPPLSLHVHTTVDGRHVSIMRSEATEARVATERGADDMSASTTAAADNPAGEPAPRRLRTPAVAALLAAVIAGAGAATAVAVRKTAPSQSGHVAATTPIPQSGDTLPIPSLSDIAVDPTDGSMVLTGCCDAGLRTATWVRAGEHWQHTRRSPTAPRYRQGSVFTFDPGMREFLLQGGDNSAETWAWDDNAWRQLHPAHEPPPGAGIATYVDAAGVLLFVSEGPGVDGGSDDVRRTASWTWDGHDWKPVAGVGPRPLGTATIGYDPATRRAVLFDEAGGPDSNAALWTFDGSAWRFEDGFDGPPTDVTTQLAWDARSRRLVAVLIGDTQFPSTGITVPATVWTWTGSGRWLLQPSQAAPEVPGHVVAWLGAVLLVANPDDPRLDPDDWVWDGQTWTRYARGGDLVARSADPYGYIAEPVLATAGLTAEPGGGPELPEGPDEAAPPLPTAPAGTEERAIRDAFPGVLQNGERLRVLTTFAARVDQRGRLLCDCLVDVVLRTMLPACPALEIVESEAVVLVDWHTGRVVFTTVRQPPPGTVFGRCGA